MSVDPQSSIRDIFLEAAELSEPAARESYLSRVCADDPELRARIDALLAADAVPPSPEVLSHASQAPALGALFPVPPTGRIGRYRILEGIGEGGCGVVFLAEQEEPVRRKVALKVIKLGMDTRQVVARFEAERQALALMEHPNIARVLDAGTTDSGQPFFVMEWVRGAKITEYCAANRLNLRQRMELFLEVCQAVHHAHQKGIIHRDLKPSNILVSQPDGSAFGIPKVIDFGIAKAIAGRLTDETLYTAVDQMMGTPAYMSPEQAAGGGADIDTRTDIYSLGVLLYQLLTGHTPFESGELLAGGFDEMRRTIREVEPERPSTRIRRLWASKTGSVKKGDPPDTDARFDPLPTLPVDLDWVVMKCLEKDRARRYETVNGLGQDLRRWLNHEPVTARPPSPAYRVQKWIRRNRITFTAACAVLLALLGGLASSTLMFIREQRARNEVEAQRSVVEQQRRAFQHRAYASDMKLAQHLVERFDLEHAVEILERHRPTSPDLEDLRGFEWRYLWQVCQGSPHDFLPGAVGMPWALVVSPDGAYVAAASDARRIAGVTVWKLQTKEIAARLEFDPSLGSDATGAVFTEDGRWLVTACHRRVKFFEVGTWREVTELTLTNASGPIDLRGHTLVTTAVGHMREPTLLDGLVVWDLRSRTSTTIHDVTGPPALSPDGRRLALRSKTGLEIRWLDHPDAPPLLLSDSKGLLADGSGYGSMKRGLAFSPDGTRIAAPGLTDARGDTPVMIWDASNGQRIDENRLIGHTARIQALSWAPDGRRIATASADGTIRIWDVEGRAEPILLTGHLSEPWSVTFHPTNNTVISSGLATWKDAVKIWHLDRSNPDSAVENEWFPLGLSRDGHQVFSATSEFEGLYRERLSGRILQRLPVPDGAPHAHSATAELGFFETPSAMGTVIGFPDGRIASWLVGSNMFPRLFKAHEGAVRAINSVAGRNWLVTGGDDRSIRWWDLHSGQLVRSNILEHPVTALAGSPDGKTLMSASGNTNSSNGGGLMFQLKEWDTDSGRLLSTQALPGLTHNVGFSPDGKWLAACALDAEGKEFTHLLEVATRTWRARFDKIGRRLDFSPDGSHLLIWYDLWDLRQDPPQSKTLSGHRQRLMHQTFSPDSRTVVSTSDDATVRLWSVETGQEMLSFTERGRSFNFPVFSADGTTLAVGSFRPDGRPIRFWQVPTLAEIDERIREGRVNR